MAFNSTSTIPTPVALAEPDSSTPEYTEKPRKRIAQLDAGNIDDYKYGFHDPEFLQNYKGTHVIYPFYQALPILEKFQARPGDICVTTFPKSGTTFVSAVVEMILHYGDHDALTSGPFLDEKIPLMDCKESPFTKDEDLLVTTISNRPSPRKFLTHLGYEAIPKSILDNAKIVYVARNPKDVIVSHFHFVRSFVTMRFKGELEDMVDAFIDNKCMYAPYFDHVAAYWKHAQENKNFFFVTYERMCKDLKGVVRDLCVFLDRDLTEEQMDNVVHHCQFDNMKQVSNVNRTSLAEAGYLDFNISHFMRVGKPGNWKEHFSPELNAKVDKWIAEQRARFPDYKLEYQYE
ncbi:putative Sulfotransferase family cytosolic 1B member 1 [Hypsibius exemplaris]|uniref:Sulfotransferase family cytosolic 1B member 1 n=1 Tax=Hypsibius exemplaris TaxID=2072580 RepID=A0A1W0WT27_HYPEX|nr:putative Sulfotransferase family cytosolic 1B member 1 [Hypsibius exemplaris]